MKPDDIHNSLTTSCQQHLDQLPPRQSREEKLLDIKLRRETSTSSSSTSSSSIEHRELQLQRSMIYINHNDGECHRTTAAHHHPQQPRPRNQWNIDGEITTSNLEYHRSDSEEGDQDWLLDAHQWQHPHQEWDDEWEEEQEEEQLHY